jgi:tetratricopeptide (TPR) repeat protein
MLRVGMSKSEIEQSLEGTGDFIQIDHLTQFLKENLTLDMKKFVCLKLAVLYEKVGMMNEAAKLYNSAGIISIAFSEKIRHFVKEAELYIKSGSFDRADEAMKKAMGQANKIEKQNIYISIKEFYKKQAEDYEEELKRNHAAIIYEKLLEMKISDQERKEIKERLLVLYDKLGKRDKYLLLEREGF